MHTRLFGAALIVGGLLAGIANGVFSPLLPIEGSFAEIAGSQAFLWRLSLAAAGLMLVALGMIGLYIRQAPKLSWFGGAAFVLGFCGTVAITAHEWAQVFFIHHIAMTVPSALDAMENVDGPNLFDAESIIVVASFSLGWILWSVSLLLGRTVPRLGPALVIIGMFGAPLFGAALIPLGANPALGPAVGGVIFALGWIMLGLALLKPPAL